MTISGLSVLLLSAVLLCLALAGIFSVKIPNMVAVGLHWLLSWLAHSFAPFLGIASLILVIWLFTANPFGPFSIWVGVISLVSAGLYLLIYWRGFRTSAVVNSVVDSAIARLDNGSGIFPSATAQPPAADGSRYPGILSDSGLRPFNFGQAQVKRFKNVAYGAMGKAHQLDIYMPAQPRPGPLPILIQVPGGAWVTGSKDQQGLPLLNRMASLGWACFSINYRLGPQARFPDMLTDVLMAIAWVKDHAHEYGADPGFVAITGGSAGGHLATLAALLQDRPLFQPGFEQADTRVSLVVPVYGRYDFLNRHQILPADGIIPFLAAKVMPGAPDTCSQLWQHASPEAQVHADAPPFLIVHGSGDSLIPVEEARAFYRALKAVSTQAVDYVELPGAQHAFDMVSSSWSLPTLAAISRYLNAHYARYLRSKDGATSPQVALDETSSGTIQVSAQ